MNELEQWISKCLGCPTEDLTVQKQWEERREGESFTAPFFSRLNQNFSQHRQCASETLLHQLHAHLRNKAFEEWVWSGTIGNISHPLPDDITHDLIDRNIAVIALAHIRQNEPVLKRLAPLVDEALLTLVGQLYRDPERSVDEFSEAFDLGPTNAWLLQHLAHGEASSPQKEAAFLKRVEGRPEWQLAHDVKAHREREQRELQEKAKRIERARIATDEDEIRGLYDTAEFEMLLELVRNPATPYDVLTSLSRSRHFPGAPQLRNEGRKALAKREQ